MMAYLLLELVCCITAGWGRSLKNKVEVRKIQPKSFGRL